MKIVNRFAISLFLIGCWSHANAQQTPDSFVQKIHYLLALPESYNSDAETKWPLLVFLHGSGESGVDVEKVKSHGPPKLIEQGKKFPFIVLSPQATNGWPAAQLLALINSIKSKYRVDNDRVYVTGLSMGGYGTWELASEYADQFAAIAPICGGGDPGKAWRLRHMPVWNFHGAKDNAVPLSASVAMINALKPLNPGVKFTIYPEAYHDSWTETYNNPELFSWLLAQKRFRYKEVTLQKAQRDALVGYYASENGDTVNVFVRNDSLFGQGTGRGANYLKAASATNFFFREDQLPELQFTKDKKGVDGFELFIRTRERYTRIKKGSKN